MLREPGSLESIQDFSDDPPVGPPFRPVEWHDVAWSNPIDAEGLLALAASRSDVIVLPRPERDAVLARVRDIVEREPGFARGGRLPMPDVTRCSRAALA